MNNKTNNIKRSKFSVFDQPFELPNEGESLIAQKNGPEIVQITLKDVMGQQLVNYINTTYGLFKRTPEEYIAEFNKQLAKALPIGREIIVPIDKDIIHQAPTPPSVGGITPTPQPDQPPVRVAVIIFHKNVRAYPPEWIKQCVESIQKQTFKNFTVFELDYGGYENQIYPGGNFISQKLKNHAEAHNFLLDLVFKTNPTGNGKCLVGKGAAALLVGAVCEPFDFAFNVNVDDFYTTDRFEKQLFWAKAGYDVISSNFYNIDENGRVMDEMRMHDKNFNKEAGEGHNIYAHPVLCYSRKFWMTCSKLNPDQIPRDDFELWKREHETGKHKFLVLPDFLLYYRSQKTAKPKSDEPQKDRFKESEIAERNRKHDEAREEWLRKTEGGR